MSTQLPLELASSSPSNSVFINARCMLQTEEDQRVIVVGGLPVYHYCAADAVAEAYAMVMLVESGFAQQTEVARAFSPTAQCAGIRSVTGRPGWRGWVGQRVGAPVVDVSPESGCASSRNSRVMD